MARPRKITDDRLLDAAGAVIGRKGPKFTLAEVAEEAGVAVGTVAGRFGSRLELLRALNVSARERIVRQFRAESTQATVARLRSALLEWFALLDDPVTAANSLAALAEDITEPVLREPLAELFGAVEAEVRALLRGAHDELPGAPPPARAARILVALVQGTAFLWSVRPQGRLRTRLALDIDAILNGWR